MAEHGIRLRGGWEWHGPDGPHRVTLPIAWPDGLNVPVRLVRAFNRPPLNTDSESLFLRFESVPGLKSARLNDVPLLVAGGSGTVPLGEPLPARNVLVLEVEPDAVAPGASWGAIALVISPRDG